MVSPMNALLSYTASSLTTNSKYVADAHTRKSKKRVKIFSTCTKCKDPPCSIPFVCSPDNFPVTTVTTPAGTAIVIRIAYMYVILAFLTQTPQILPGSLWHKIQSQMPIPGIIHACVHRQPAFDIVGGRRFVSMSRLERMGPASGRGRSPAEKLICR